MPTTMIAPAPAETVMSDLLGPIAAAPGARYAFPAGLYGFDACRGFVLVPAGRPALYWLQSTEAADLVFLLADPGHFFPQHEIDVSAHDLEALAGPAASGDDFAALVVVTLGETRGTATANLQAPVVFHAPSHTARQVVIDDGQGRVRVPLAVA